MITLKQAINNKNFENELKAHNPKVVSSNLTPATKKLNRVARDCGSYFFDLGVILA